MRRSKHQRGQAIAFVMLAMIPVCLVVGLVVDVGIAYYTKTSARTAAQMAALAAIQSAMDGVYAGGTYTCGSQSLGCQSPGACPNSGNLQKGCLYATADGFATGGSQTVLIDANTTIPPVANITSANYWVRVQIVQQNRLTFGAMTGMQWLNAGETAVAAAVNMMPLNCVVALDASASSAIDLIGHVNLTTTDCGVAVNSNSSTALATNGNTILSASSISVVGGTDTSGSVSPTPVTGIEPFPDPLEGVPAPTVPSGCSHPTPTTANGITTYYPGNYCGGLSFGGGANAAFSPGTYFLISGLSISGNATLTGSGVTFYNTFNSTYPYQGISMAGTGSVTLSAPTSGSFEGMLFFEDRNAPTGASSSIKGNSSLNLTGAIYLPKDALTFSGNASSQQVMLVADTISMNGNVTLAINPESAAAPLTPQIGAALIQ
jgi:hypothetical protein